MHSRLYQGKSVTPDFIDFVHSFGSKNSNNEYPGSNYIYNPGSGSEYITAMVAGSFWESCLPAPGINPIYKTASEDRTCLKNIFKLYSNFPNPFNPVTTISFQLPEKSNVRISVYNIRGELVEELVNDQKVEGLHSITWNATGCSSGMYFYKIVANSYIDIKRMLLLK